MSALTAADRSRTYDARLTADRHHPTTTPLAHRLAVAAADPIGVMSEHDNTERTVIGVDPEDLVALMRLAGVDRAAVDGSVMA